MLKLFATFSTCSEFSFPIRAELSACMTRCLRHRLISGRLNMALRRPHRLQVLRAQGALLSLKLWLRTAGPKSPVRSGRPTKGAQKARMRTPIRFRQLGCLARPQM